jgi:3-oxoacyl-[acyl-carrier protein] reductase
MSLTAKFTDGNPDKVLQPQDLAQMLISNLKLPQRAFVKEIGLWSTNP